MFFSSNMIELAWPAQAPNHKYIYNPEKKIFTGASKSMNKQLMGRSEIQQAIKKALNLLGEE
ncbi:MAG TPA: hypothetical protein VJ810_35655 [Blastocatellia bacterium]|nr:hypothetical protein [Blastocatellia bacterium]